MRLDLAKAVAALAPWEMDIDLGGRVYPTRRPSIGMIARLEDLKQSAPMGEVIATVHEIFPEGGVPEDLAEWQIEALLAVVGAYLSCFAQHAAKNSNAIAAAVRAAIAPEATEATPPSKAAGQGPVLSI